MRKREHLGLIVLVILITPILIVKNLHNKLRGRGNAVSIDYSWFLGPLVIPARWIRRGWQATRRALGWDQLR